MQDTGCGIRDTRYGETVPEIPISYLASRIPYLASRISEPHGMILGQALYNAKRAISSLINDERRYGAFGIREILALRELEAPPSAFAAVFLPLFDACVAGEHAVGAQGLAQGLVILHQRAGDAVAHGAGLAGVAAA